MTAENLTALKPFAIARADGRSNSQVILEHLAGAQPGTIYTYDELADVLGRDTGRSYSVEAVRGAVYCAAKRILKEQSRALMNIPGRGYKLAYAVDHAGISTSHVRRSEGQLRRAFDVLRHVRWDEMDENARKAHEGHLMIASALYQNQRLMWKKQRAVETALQSLKERVDAIAPEAVS
jgi:hypothetical protein